MRLILCAFVAGVCALQGLPQLPPIGWSLAALLVAAFALRRVPLALAVLAGLAWALWHAHLGLAARLPPALDGTAFTLSGRIAGLPGAREGITRFELRVSSLSRGRHPGPPLRRVALTDYTGHLPVTPGADCLLQVRLKTPHGARNPAGQDYERWLFSQRIDATGYVIAHPVNACVAARWHGSLGRLRLQLAADIASAVETAATAGVLRALAVGERASMSTRQWQVLQATGTTHLVSISGLHVSMVAVAAFAVVRWLWSLWPALTRRVPAPFVAAALGFAAAFAYALLAGFTVPTQRTLLMLGCMAWQRQRGQRLLNVDGLLLALAIVVLLDPLAVLTASCWLSFGAMGALVALTAVLRDGGLVMRALGVHLWLAFALAPLLALISPLVAWTSPLGNLVAVPVVTWLVVPLVLVGMLAALLGLPGAPLCWQLAGRIWELCWAVLGAMADLAPVWRLPHAIAPATVPLVLLGLALCLVPLGRARLWLVPLLCASPWLAQPPIPAHGDLRMTVLDVGQGLSVLLQTRRHALLFDAGPVTRGGRDAGAAIVVPNLWAAGVRRLDRLVLSHPDIDHAGGAQAVLQGVDVARVMVNAADPWPAPAEYCVDGMAWAWDGVAFEVLHPAAGMAGSDNHMSCVLRVTTAGGRHFLLTGDIDAAAEAALVARHPVLAADVLIVPHHGSASSSSPALLAAVQPRYAIHTAGYGNRFGFPAPAVVERYAALGSRQFVTGARGAVLIDVVGAGLRVQAWRDLHRRYWHAR